MHDTTITVQGYAGTDVELRHVADTSVATFRLAATPRRFDKRLGEWVDAPTQWYTVKAWRTLGRNVSYAIRRGDPVIVHGRLVANNWEKDGQAFSSMELEATMVGHDLNRGITSLQKLQKPVDPFAEPVEAPEPVEPVDAEQQAEVTIGSLGEKAPEEWLPEKHAA